MSPRGYQLNEAWMTLVGILSAGNTPQQLSAWSFAHARDHDDIDAALAAAGFPQPTIPLDPLPALDNVFFWLINHQQKHNAMNAAFGLTGDDLTKYDFTNKENLDAFVGINYSEHTSVYQIFAAQGVLVGG
jgi:hypothetical protein